MHILVAGWMVFFVVRRTIWCIDCSFVGINYIRVVSFIMVYSVVVCMAACVFGVGVQEGAGDGV